MGEIVFANSMKALTTEQLRVRSRITSAVMLLVLAYQGFWMGSSPLLTRMNEPLLRIHPGWFPFIAPGVTQTGETALLGWMLWMPLVSGLIQRRVLRVPHLGVLQLLTCLSWLSVGISAQFPEALWWIQFVGTVVGTIGSSAILYLVNIIVVQWWAATDEAHIGAAIIGATYGGGSILGTLVNGWLCSILYFPVVMYVLSAYVFVSGLFLLRLSVRGELQSPPPRSDLSPDRTSEQLTAIGVFGSPAFWRLAYVIFCVTFTGMGMKALLTSIYENTYHEPYLNSVYLAALSLILFAVLRAVTPLCTKYFQASWWYPPGLMMMAVLYGLCPLIIEHLPVGFLVSAKMLTGGCYSGLSSLSALLVKETFGSDGLAVAMPFVGLAMGTGFALGPVAGFYIYSYGAECSGESHCRTAYNPFFFLCCIVAGSAALLSSFHAFMLAWSRMQFSQVCKDCTGTSDVA
jgi:MFS family permease